jgi:hypothetical protein
MLKDRRSMPFAMVAVVLVLAGCLPGKRYDPGDLEVRNWLRDPVAVIVGGQAYTAPACSTVRFADVELRRVRIVSPSGSDLMRIDSLTGSPIGPRRFILIDAQGAHDLRTTPNGQPPGPGAPACFGTVRELEQQLRDRGLLRGP